MLKMKKISETTALKVYTDDGLYFGEVEEALIKGNKIESWKIRASRESFLSKAIAGAKGVIIPHLMVKAIGDVMLVARSAAPSYSEEEGTS
jgi:sporulation protein YlmC with PRC-barrel domain